MEFLQEFDAVFGALLGVPAFIAVLINVLKAANIVKNNEAPEYAKWMNLVAYGGLFALYQFAPDVDLLAIDELAGAVGEFGVAALALVPLGVKIAGLVHDGFRGLPLIGKSHG